MVSKKILLAEARNVIRSDLLLYIRNELYHPEGGYLKLQFTNGSTLCLTYNDHSEYSYQYLYSLKDFDKERFDNYDKQWDVSSKPHHYDPRHKKQAKTSPMNGGPVHDMPLLSKLLLAKLKRKQT